MTNIAMDFFCEMNNFTENYVYTLINESESMEDFVKKVYVKHQIVLCDNLANKLYNSYWAAYSAS